MTQFRKLILNPFLFALFVLMCSPFARGESEMLLLSDAGKAYHASDYAQAAALYEKVLAKGFVNGVVLFNLGNSYYRQERVGEAIAAFRGAARFLPRDAEVAANLDYARKRRVDVIEDKKTPVEQLLFWVNWISFKEALWALGVFGFFMSAWMLIRFRFSRMALWPAVVLSFVFLFFAVTTAAKCGEWVDVPAAVVIAPEVSVRSGNSDANVVLFVVHAGTEVTLGESRGDWAQVGIADGRKGWVREEFLKRVVSEFL